MFKRAFGGVIVSNIFKNSEYIFQFQILVIFNSKFVKENINLE